MLATSEALPKEKVRGTKQSVCSPLLLLASQVESPLGEGGQETGLPDGGQLGRDAKRGRSLTLSPGLGGPPAGVVQLEEQHAFLCIVFLGSIWGV